MTTPSEPRATPRRLQLWRILAYFVLLGLFAVINLELFRELASSAYVEGFTRLSELLTSLMDVTRKTDDILVTVFSLLVTFLLVVPVGWVYLITKEEEGIDPALTQTLIVLGVVVCGVMLLLEDNLARAFGLVGVVAAVRYRNTLRDPKDAVYVFLVIGIGMGCGLRAYHVAVFLSIIVCGIFLLLWKFRTGTSPLGEVTLMQQLAGKQKSKRLPTPSQAAAIFTPAARARLRAEMEQQVRLASLAGLQVGPGRKAPNAALIIETAGAADAQGAIHGQLADHPGRWRLVHSGTRDGVTVLEYLGRLRRKNTPPADLMARIRSVDPAIRQVDFCSLRGVSMPEGANGGRVADVDEGVFP